MCFIIDLKRLILVVVHLWKILNAFENHENYTQTIKLNLM